MDALKEAQRLLAEAAHSERAVRRKLTDSGCGEDEVRETLAMLRETGTDYERECLRCAQEICGEQPWTSRRALRAQLEKAGFLPPALAYTDRTLPVNWFDHARSFYERSAQPGVDPSAAQQKLADAGFKAAEIVYALGELPESEEEEAWQKAQYMLGAAPSSEPSVRSELAETYDEWAVQTVIERLGDIWADQALAAAWRLVGRYGPLISQQRLGSYLRMQGFTLIQAAQAVRDVPVDWNSQALQCARFYYFRKNMPPGHLRGQLREHQFTGSQIRSALQNLRR